MHEEEYPSEPTTSNPFSGFRPWWSVRAQWEILEIDFTRPKSRSSKNYPPPQQLKLVALALSINADKQTGEVWISLGSLAQQLGYAPSTKRKMRLALNALRDDFGVIEFIRSEAPKTGRRYRILLGWKTAKGAKVRTLDPAKIVIIRDAYREARLEAHCVANIPSVRPEVMGDLLRMIGDVSGDTGDTFEGVAILAMRLFMEERGMDDGKLRTAHHPLDWVRPYLSNIERRIRLMHRKRTAKANARGEEAAPMLDLAAGAEQLNEHRRNARQAIEMLTKGGVRKTS